MHQTYLTLATVINRERMREAAAWRLGESGREAPVRATLGGRFRTILAAIASQPLGRPSLVPDASEPC